MNDKINRQLRIYMYIRHTKLHGPDDLMDVFGISRRMLQRDLKDLRDCGMISLKYQRTPDRNYIESKDPVVFDESSTGRHRQHLNRLRRLCTLTDKLPQTDMSEITDYENALEEYIYYRDEGMVEDPYMFPPEELGEPPEIPALPDIKGIYYELFPDSNERMRQRDFKELNEAGFEIYYDRKYKVFIVDAE